MNNKYKICIKQFVNNLTLIIPKYIYITIEQRRYPFQN